MAFASPCFGQDPWRLNTDGSTTIEAERPIQVEGRNGLVKRKVASGGEVLGAGWGSETGDFAELFFRTPKPLTPARIRFRYARQHAGDTWLSLMLDSRPLGRLRFPSTGSDGTVANGYREIDIDIGNLPAGYHRLYLTVVADGMPSPVIPQTKLVASPILDSVGNRNDKNAVGHGKNLAIYTGRGASKRYFFATHELGNVFSGTDGETLSWNPDHVLLEGNSARVGQSSELLLDTVTFEEKKGRQAESLLEFPEKIVEQRQVCVTHEDVVVSRIWCTNLTGKKASHIIRISGDSRRSFDWREQPRGERFTEQRNGRILLIDPSVFPDTLSNGLCMAIGTSLAPSHVDISEPGSYQLQLEIDLEPGQTKTLTAACAFERSRTRALENLETALNDQYPLKTNRDSWIDFYTRQVPTFECSDPGLEELYRFRWFLLRFSTAGGDLGYFRYPVVMEGRQAYQTYCCYSAPFMALDLNWSTNPRHGFGHIANMAYASYEDGRFPWYTSPRTNQVKLDHASRTGLSLLPHTAWRHYLIHQDLDLLKEVYPSMVKNCDWWLKDRDPNQDGIFDVAHQLETGQDDLFRWGKENREMRYDAVDATSYAILNMKATANMAKALGDRANAERLNRLANRSTESLRNFLWDNEQAAYFDRHPGSGELAADYLAITTFYPFFANAAGKRELGVFKRHLFDPDQFWLPYPVPALPKSHPDYGPNRFWQGPSWPAATSHVIEALAHAGKSHDRNLLPQAADLLKRAAANHMQPRADFFERYNPETGKGLSLFRDYMHSWWIDIYLQHIVGLTLGEDGSLWIDPLPLGLKHFRSSNIPFGGNRLTVDWGQNRGLTVECRSRTGKTRTLLRAPDFQPGDSPQEIEF
ncbi:MAG: trehalase family glycosidase [Planctomycetota bacterium]|nr:trehalase family glycosidase [Planctomycetota bacterium]